jgi:hypothetical protein
MKKIIFLVFILASAVAMAQTEIKLSAQEKKELDTFFSNFSEARVENFTPETLSGEALLQFGLTYNYINNFKSLKASKDGLSAIVSSDLIDAATEKYFGTKIKSHKSKEYSVPMADGEAYTFSQIRSLEKIENEKFRAKGEIFVASSGAVLNAHGTREEWKKAGEEVICAGSFEAILKKSPKDKDRYILLQYQVIPREDNAE